MTSYPWVLSDSRKFEITVEISAPIGATNPKNNSGSETSGKIFFMIQFLPILVSIERFMEDCDA
jgi:hypothetical protein